MIATLTGRVAEVNGGCCILDVQGVGYEIYLPLPALEEVSQTAGEIKLHTHLHLREDGVQLFGFLNDKEKRIFLKLISVTGIGPKLALSMLSVLPAERLCQAVDSEDCRLLSSVPGIGQKTAQRLVLELRGKLSPRTAVESSPAAAKTAGEAADAVEALVALGYPTASALQAVEAAAAQEGACAAPALIRAALKSMAAKG